MADIVLKYLTDLASAAPAENDDLMHINQGGNDRSITIGALITAIVEGVYPPGITIWFNSDANPNVLFPGTVWARLAGAGRTIRIANATGSDVGQMGGSDTVSLSADNLPSHSHPVSGTTALHDYGTLTTSSAGAHTHRGGVAGPGARWADFVTGTDNSGTYSKNYTSSDGEHTHTVAIGAHTHSFSVTSGAVGSGTPFSTTNQYIKQAAWYRVS